MTPPLATERLRLDPLDVADAAELAGALADPALYAFIGGEPPTKDGLRADIERWNEGPSRPGEAWHNWAIRFTSDGTLIGQLQATLLDDGARADIAWIVGTPWQGQGCASEAAIQLVRWLTSTGVVIVTAHVNAENLASARVAERAGLVRTDVVEGAEVVWRRTVTQAENLTR